ncbi:10752_t:CDS:2, partial [Entrophospora sp. SA101]
KSTIDRSHPASNTTTKSKRVEFEIPLVITSKSNGKFPQAPSYSEVDEPPAYIYTTMIPPPPEYTARNHLPTINRDKVEVLFPSDAIERAGLLLKQIENIGAYSHSQGIPHIRQNVAKFIEDPDNIFLTQGASPGVQNVVQLIVSNNNVGIMIPIPQYPLYTSTLALYDAQTVPYYLDDDDGWSLKLEELYRSYLEAKGKGIDVRALVIINPGNPTGQCLTEQNIREIIKFCYKEGLILLADEVYQANVYQPVERPFHSFKKILRSMGQEYEGLELFSFHSVSKGMIGECGKRGGYFECTGIDMDVVDELYKVASVNLCPNVEGQIIVDLMVKPPKIGDKSYPLYDEEIKTIYESLKRRSQKLCELFNRLEGVSCNSAHPDEFYCLAMLESTGVCVVPGSGFGQKEGTWHFRSTFLPPEELFDGFCKRLENFHKEFLVKYRD